MLDRLFVYTMQVCSAWLAVYLIAPQTTGWPHIGAAMCFATVAQLRAD